MEIYNPDVSFNYQSKLIPKMERKFYMPTIGDLKWSILSTDHDIWLLCDGSEYLEEEYPYLYQAIGHTFGTSLSGNPLLPNMTGRVPAVPNQSFQLGDATGSYTHTLTVQEMPTHNHTNSITTNGAHVHTNTVSTNGAHTHTNSVSTNGAHTHSSNAIGGQGNLGLCYADGNNTVVDTDGSQGELNVWTLPYALTINSNGDHNHTVTINSAGDHNHTVTINSAGDHTHTVTVNNNGGNQAHNNIQPTLFVGYVFICAK